MSFSIRKNALAPLALGAFITSSYPLIEGCNGKMQPLALGIPVSSERYVESLSRLSGSPNRLEGERSSYGQKSQEIKAALLGVAKACGSLNLSYDDFFALSLVFTSPRDSRSMVFTVNAPGVENHFQLLSDSVYQGVKHFNSNNPYYFVSINRFYLRGDKIVLNYRFVKRED